MTIIDKKSKKIVKIVDFIGYYVLHSICKHIRVLKSFNF